MPGMKGLSREEVDALIRQFPVKYGALVALGCMTGGRITELLSLRRQDILSAPGVLVEHVKLPDLKKKKKSFRLCKVSPVFGEHVLKHLEEEANRGYEQKTDWVFRGQFGLPLSRRSARNFFYRHLGKGYGTHFMRKTFAQLLFSRFSNISPNAAIYCLEKTRSALGHTRIDNTIKYLGYEKNVVDDAIEDIFDRKEV